MNTEIQKQNNQERIEALYKEHNRIEAFNKDLGQLMVLLGKIKNDHSDLIRNEELVGRWYSGEIEGFDLATLDASLACNQHLEELQDDLRSEEGKNDN